jgi:nickel/cobalt exporter
VVLMGVAGGLVPTPSALLVLLGAAALGRTWFGVVLVGAYGIGMAATLVIAGVVLVRLQGWLEQHWYGSPWLRATMRYAPIVTAGLLMAGGLSVALRGATQLS